jgi:hypothetical protein
MASNGLLFPTPHGRLCFSPFFSSWQGLSSFFFSSWQGWSSFFFSSWQGWSSFFFSSWHGLSSFSSHHGRQCSSPSLTQCQVAVFYFFHHGIYTNLSFYHDTLRSCSSFSSWQVRVLFFLLIMAEKRPASFLSWNVCLIGSFHFNMTGSCPLLPFHKGRLGFSPYFSS